MKIASALLFVAFLCYTTAAQNPNDEITRFPRIGSIGPPHPPDINPPDCEWLCFNNQLSIVAPNGTVINDNGLVMVGTTYDLTLRVGINDPILLYCCDNYFLQALLFTPNNPNEPAAEFIINDGETTWGFPYFWCKQNDCIGGWSPALIINVGEYTFTENDYLDGCWTGVAIETFQKTTGDPNFPLFNLFDTDWVRLGNPDTNGDGLVNQSDLVEVILSWSETEGPADIDCNQIVNIQDLLLVLNNWNLSGI